MTCSAWSSAWPPSFNVNLTLLGGANGNGNGEKSLIRHAVAAILNAAHPGVSYAFTVSQIVALVQGAYATGNFDAAKNLLATENERR